MTLHFRIPAWAEGASIFVNGQRQKGLAMQGQFAGCIARGRAAIASSWNCRLRMRLETIDAQHADTVALLRGPVVLMAVKPQQESPLPKITREQLLAAQRVSEREWQAQSASGPVTLLPFTWIGDRPYTSYLRVA